MIGLFKTKSHESHTFSGEKAKIKLSYIIIVVYDEIIRNLSKIFLNRKPAQVKNLLVESFVQILI